MRRRRDADESYVEGRRREPSHSKKRTSASSHEEETEFSILGVRRDGFRLHFTGTDGFAFRFSRETVRISFYIEYIITALPEFLPQIVGPTRVDRGALFRHGQIGKNSKTVPKLEHIFKPGHACFYILFESLSFANSFNLDIFDKNIIFSQFFKKWRNVIPFVFPPPFSCPFLKKKKKTLK